MPRFTSSTYSSYMAKWLVATGVFEALLATGFVVAALTSDNPRNGFLLTAAILGATAIALIAFGWRAHRRAAEARRIDQTGMPGQASITGMTQTGVYVNEQPQIALELMVEIPGRPAYPAGYRGIIPLMLLGRLNTGMPLAVKVDPADPQNLVIDWDAAPPSLAQQRWGAALQPPGWPATTPATASQAGSGSQDESLGQIQRAMQSAGMQAAPVYASSEQGGYTIEQLRAYLRESGIAGTATIDHVEDSGTTVGDERMLSMEATINVPGRAPIKSPRSVAMVPLTAVGKVFAGTTVPVKVAPDNPDVVMFEWEKV
jgi:hypothetical protein